jgi:hypothetical protein
MEKNNVQPDHLTSSILLNVIKKTKASAKDAWEFFQRMNRKGINWSLEVADALINIFCCEGADKGGSDHPVRNGGERNTIKHGHR